MARYIEESEVKRMIIRRGWMSEEELENSSVVADLPSAHRKGKWVIENIVLTSNPPQYRWHCSECEKSIIGFTAAILTDYCPNCGAEMVKGESDE